jgi:hypothetical protein
VPTQMAHTKNQHLRPFHRSRTARWTRSLTTAQPLPTGRGAGDGVAPRRGEVNSANAANQRDSRRRSSLALLRSAVRPHSGRLSVEPPMGRRQKKDPAVAWGLDGVSQLLTKLLVNHHSRFKRRLVQTGNSQIEFEAAWGSGPPRLILAARRGGRRGQQPFDGDPLMVTFAIRWPAQIS